VIPGFPQRSLATREFARNRLSWTAFFSVVCELRRMPFFHSLLRSFSKNRWFFSRPTYSMISPRASVPRPLSQRFLANPPSFRPAVITYFFPSLSNHRYPRPYLTHDPYGYHFAPSHEGALFFFASSIRSFPIPSSRATLILLLFYSS